MVAELTETGRAGRVGAASFFEVVGRLVDEFKCAHRNGCLPRARVALCRATRAQRLSDACHRLRSWDVAPEDSETHERRFASPCETRKRP
jgi:hypothetical protein